MKALLDGLRGLGAARLAAMGVVAIGMLGMLGMLALRGAGPSPYALLYADLDLREAGQLVEQLDKAHIAHQEQAGGQTVLVPSADVARARLLLAKDGLPSGGSIGYEIFDRGDSLTASSFQQEINQTRAMEGEIARSIRMISGIRAVRVHLVLPRRQPFTREQQDAQASVVLTMAGGQALDREGTQAVLNLVAAAVPGLRPNNISVVDSRGDLLARAGSQGSGDLAAQSGGELERQTAQRLQHSVEEMLERTLGPGHVRAEAMVQMDFTQTKQTEESYNPDQQVVRSTQTSTDSSKSTEAAEKPATVSNNLPNADAGTAAGQAGSQQSRNQETTNYEIGRTTRTVVSDQPRIKRVSLAVMVDGVTTPGADGKPAWHERSPEELARIAALVRSAVGFDDKRGDKVEVASMRFAAPDEPVEEAPHGTTFAGLRLEKQDLLGLAQTGVLALVAMLALLFVLRPMVTRLTAVPALAGGAGSLALPAPGGGAIEAQAAPLGLPAPSGALSTQADPDERMVSLAQIDGQMRASSIRRVADLVERHPEESLGIVRAWVAQERD